MENPKFRQEYQTFKDIIENIADPNKKAECQKLLKQFLYEAGMIDQKHGELTVTPKIDDSVGEHRRTLFEIRKKLSRLAK